MKNERKNKNSPGGNHPPGPELNKIKIIKKNREIENEIKTIAAMSALPVQAGESSPFHHL